MRHIILSIFILPFYLGLNAQELATEKATDTIPEGISVDEVQVVKAFEANLKKARNYDVKPEIPTIPVTHPNYKYKLTLTPIKIDYPEPQLRPLAMKPDDPFDVNRFYAKLGYGTIQNPWVDISYSDVQKESHYFGIGAHYDAADQSKTSKSGIRTIGRTYGIRGKYVVSRYGSRTEKEILLSRA